MNYYLSHLSLMLLEQVPSVGSLLNLTGNNSRVTLYNFREADQAFFREHWIVARNKTFHCTHGYATASGGIIGRAFAAISRFLVLREILHYRLVFAFTFEQMFNFVPEVEPKLVDLIALQSQSNNWRIIVVNPEANPLDFRTGKESTMTSRTPHSARIFGTCLISSGSVISRSRSGIAALKRDSEKQAIAVQLPVD